MATRRWRSRPYSPANPAALLDPDLSDYVRQVLERTEVTAASLKFEVTENSLISNVGAARQALDRLHALGVELMLDDFATGDSSMSHLQLFPFDYIKIDGPFDSRGASSQAALASTRSAAPERGAEALVRVMTQTAKALGLMTLADGSFSFPVLGLTQATQFRVVTTTKSPVVSPVALENVAVGIDSHLGRANGRHRVRVYGAVTPAEDGSQVGIMRIEHGRNVLVAGTKLLHRTATSSRFSRVLRVKPGVYRVLVRVTNGAQVSSYGRPLVIH